MRTITTIKDLYWAFAEMHSANSIITAGERKEYTLEDGRVVYVTEEEKQFLEAIKKFECVDAPAAPATPVTIGDLIKACPHPDAPADVIFPKPEFPPAQMLDAQQSKRHTDAGPISLFSCLCRLKRYGLAGYVPHNPPDYAVASIGAVREAITVAMKLATKDCKDMTHELNEKQKEMTFECTTKYLWKVLGGNFDKALANATKKLVCSGRTDAYDCFVRNFLQGHARVGINKYGRAILYSTECTLGCEGEHIKFPVRDEILNSDLKYGVELGEQDALAMQLHMLQMYRVLPENASKCYGSYAHGIRDTIGRISKNPINQPVPSGEVEDMYSKHFPLLEEAIKRGVKRVMSFIYCSPFYDRIPVGEYRDGVNTDIAEQVKDTVRNSLVALKDTDFDTIMKTMDAMRSKNKWTPFKRYPGAIIMKHIRMAFHWAIWQRYTMESMRC